MPTEIVFSQENLPDSHPNTLDFCALKDGQELGYLRVESIGGGDISIEGHPEVSGKDIYPENSFAEIADFCKWRYINRLSDYVLMNEGPEIFDFLMEVWQTMKQTIADGLAATGTLPGGLGVQRKAKYLYEQELTTEVPQVRECRAHLRLCLCGGRAERRQRHHRHCPPPAAPAA